MKLKREAVIPSDLREELAQVEAIADEKTPDFSTGWSSFFCALPLIVYSLMIFAAVFMPMC